MTNDERCTIDLMQKGEYYAFTGGTIDGPYATKREALDDIEEDMSREFGVQSNRGVVFEIVEVTENDF